MIRSPARLGLVRFSSTSAGGDAAPLVSTVIQPATLLRLTAQAKIRAVEQRDGKSKPTRDPSTPLTPFVLSTAGEHPQLNTYPQPLVDSFHRMHDYLRISLTERCNLRCFYCMPEEGIDLSPRADILTDDEIIRLAALFVRKGVKKIRLTGGEPSIRPGIVDLIGRLNALRPLGLESIGMTSNGLALYRKLPQMIENGLTHLNLSLDTLDPIKFEKTTRRRGHEAVLKSLSLALDSQHLKSVKLNVVVVKGINENEVPAFVELARDAVLSVRFIEFMPFSGNAWNKDKLVPSAELLSRLHSLYPGIQKAPDSSNDTARSYTIPGFKGSFGFISSMSDHFCSSCNRLRITADGKIKVCLFDGAEISLRDQMRRGASDDELSNIIGYAVGQKKEKHEAMEDIDTVGNRPMILIGGTRNPRRGRAGTASQFTRAAPGSLRHCRTFKTIASASLTHVDAAGRQSMVDVSDKVVTKRSATATGRIHLTPDSFALLYPTLGNMMDLSEAQCKALSKGPVLSTAQLAGILAAKQTSTIIPLCHPLTLTHVQVDFTPEPETLSVRCEATVQCSGKTGVEMEALMAVNGALLCVWDMLKAVAGQEMRITDVMVVKKSGGKSGNWHRIE